MNIFLDAFEANPNAFKAWDKAVMESQKLLTLCKKRVREIRTHRRMISKQIPTLEAFVPP